MKPYRGPTLPKPDPTPTAPPPVPGFAKRREKRYLCFTCPDHPQFLTKEAFAAHLTEGHPA
jgi:hypothetical protein